jgi:hypothetical protein
MSLGLYIVVFWRYTFENQKIIYSAFSIFKTSLGIFSYEKVNTGLKNRKAEKPNQTRYIPIREQGTRQTIAGCNDQTVAKQNQGVLTTRVIPVARSGKTVREPRFGKNTGREGRLAASEMDGIVTFDTRRLLTMGQCSQ